MKVHARKAIAERTQTHDQDLGPVSREISLLIPNLLSAVEGVHNSDSVHLFFFIQIICSLSSFSWALAYLSNSYIVDCIVLKAYLV